MSAPRTIVIVGAGLAGLSLACALVQRGYAGTITIVDAKRTFSDDRSWCWWDVPDVPFRSAVSHAWSAWSCAAGGVESVQRSGAHPYLYLRGADFYAEACAQLGDARVEFRLGEPVEAIEECGAFARVHAPRGIYDADLAIDARGIFGTRPALVQSFVGRFVRTPHEAFDRTTVTLMDVHGTGDTEAPLRFTYVLPFDARFALVEETVVAPQAVPRERLVAAFDATASRLKLGAYAFERHEAGSIPMDARRLPIRTSQHVWRVGTAGGAVRPSSGYAFVRTQRQVAACAEAIVAGTQPRVIGARFRFYDELLRALLQAARITPGRFYPALAARTDADLFARFMTDHSTMLDETRLFAAAAAALATLAVPDARALRYRHAA